jgi:hypothetical protein
MIQVVSMGHTIKFKESCCIVKNSGKNIMAEGAKISQF